MKKIIFIITLMFLNLFASDKCFKVIKGYESQDKMYVLCDSLLDISQNKANKLISHIMSQYKGPPDEIMVYFIPSKKLIGLDNLSDLKELTGYYYTHDSTLVISPNRKNKRTINLDY